VRPWLSQASAFLSLLVVVGTGAWLSATPSLTREACSKAFSEHRRGGHELRELAETLRVREVRGVITSEAGPWPEDAGVILQLWGPVNNPSLRTVAVPRGGEFRMRGLQSGQYCFEASASGWDPVAGRIEVSPNSRKDARIRLSMPLAK